MGYEEQLQHCQKRFSITHCLNNKRQFPTNILSERTAEQKPLLEETAEQHMIKINSELVKKGDDKRRLWY